MVSFDTNVQQLKYKVLRELARHTWNQSDPFMVFNEIANTIVKKGEPTMSCCIYKDRAIVAERMRKALGGTKEDPNVIQIIDIACDECPEAGYVVTDLCRGCLAHSCSEVCPKGAVEFDDKQRAHIDKTKCVECGRCYNVCPYDAIANLKRPCERACKVEAIRQLQGEMSIDPDKCMRCGECVYKCPFGATLDVSSITDIIRLIIAGEGGTKYKIHAIVAPAIAGQFKYASTGQIVSAMRELGFDYVEETAVGADMVAWGEAEELKEKGFLTSSCCPAFVTYVKNNFPELKDNISSSHSPMITLAKAIKNEDPECKVVFVGPCTSKKGEIRRPEVSGYVDYVMTFEELQALIDSRDIDVPSLEESEFSQVVCRAPLHKAGTSDAKATDVQEADAKATDDEAKVHLKASGYGRKFARTGGVSEAVARVIEERGYEDLEFNPIVCDGVDKCRSALMRAKKGVLPNNFIEGMICEGGCVGGAACVTHGPADIAAVDAFGDTSDKKSIKTF